MNRHFFTAAFLAGALGIVWAGAGFIDSSLLALSITVVIGAVYAVGALELRRFRQATFSLGDALKTIPEGLTELGTWLERIDPSLQNPVRLRIEGERAALPGPALTPYLVGLLVMLGMLGTFVGMVVTLNGAVFALEKTADLEAIRSALAVPVMGLGLAFGTSIAGVVASAMLGLMSALCRRERIAVSQLLDTRIATSLRRFSMVHQRQETFRALQLQSEALPQVVGRLQEMMAQMEGMSQQLNQRLLGNQEAFHDSVRGVYTELARAVDKSLRESLAQSGQAAGESIRPVVEAAMSGIAQEATRMHERTAHTVQQQLDQLSVRFGQTAATVAESWQAAVKQQERANEAVSSQLTQGLTAFSDTFEQRTQALVAGIGDNFSALQAGQAERDGQRQQAWTQSLRDMAAALTRELQEANTQTLARQQTICDSVSRMAQEVGEQAQASVGRTLQEVTRLVGSAEELMRGRIEAEAKWMEQHRERMDQLAGLLHAELGALRDEEAARGREAVERLGQLQAALATHLTTLGTALEEPITRLIQTASEAPRAAADVISQLRREISTSVARDNELLEERSRIMETLNALLEAINHATVEQRAVIDSLVASSAAALDASATAYSDKLSSEATKLSDIAAEVAGSAVEVSTLSEAFGFAVRSFSEANEKLIENLQRIEGAMDKSMSRSDEQLAYYVAQAREIIDLSMSSQKEIVEQLRQLPARQATLAEEAP